MKKFLLILCSVLGACLLSCSKQKAEPVVKNVESTLDFDSIVVKDYELVKASTSDSVKFYEAQIVFDKNVNADTMASPVRILTVMQTEDTVWTVNHSVNEEPVVTKQFGFWLEDTPINVYSIKVPLDSALICLAKANCKTPESNLCVFRKPLYKDVYKDAFYIFGSLKTSFVTVDCGTGAVKPMEVNAKKRMSISK